MFMSFNFEFHCNYVEFTCALFMINRTIIVALSKWTKGSQQNFEVEHIRLEISLEMVDNNTGKIYRPYPHFFEEEMP